MEEELYQYYQLTCEIEIIYNLRDYNLNKKYTLFSIGVLTFRKIGHIYFCQECEKMGPLISSL